MKRLFFLSVLSFLVFTGCMNAVNPMPFLNLQEHEYYAESNQNAIDDGLIKISGKIVLDGAVPSLLNGQNNDSQNYFFKTAMPAKPAEIIYKLWIPVSDIDLTTLSSTTAKYSEGGAYELSVPPKRNTMFVEGYACATIGECNESNLILGGAYDYTQEQVLSGGVINDIPVSPKTDGNGKVKLPICVESPSEVKSFIASWDVAGVNKLVDGDFTSSDPIDFYMTESGMSEDIPAGVYDVKFIFYDSGTGETGNIVYQCIEKINVFSNMTTDTWHGGGSPHISSGQLKITGDCVNAFKRKDFYVKSDASTGGVGTYFEPCTISKAWSYIKAVNDGTSNYNIFLLSDITAADSDIGSEGFIEFSYSDSKNLLLTVSSYNNPAVPYKIDAARLSSSAVKGRVMYIGGDNLSVELKNIQLTGGYTGTSVNGGSIYLTNNAKLTIGEGCKISGNYSGGSGGAVFINNSKVTMTGGELTDNLSFYYGVCVFNDGGTLKMQGGKIWKNGIVDLIHDDRNADYYSSIPSSLQIEGACYISHITILESSTVIDITGDITPLTEGDVTYPKMILSCGVPPRKVFDTSNVYFNSNYTNFVADNPDYFIDSDGYFKQLPNSPYAHNAVTAGCSKIPAYTAINLPVGTYLIEDKNDLASLRSYTQYGRLTAGSTFIQTADIIYGTDFVPIGTETKPFSGTYDGNGYKIQYSAIITTGGYAGIFGVIEDSTIENLVVRGTVTNCPDYGGGVVGLSKGMTTINNCISFVNISCTGAGICSMGGIVGGTQTASASTGAASSLQIRNCINDGNIEGAGNLGGIVGFAAGQTDSGQANANVLNIYNCANYGKITAKHNTDIVGGIVGKEDCNMAIIENCFNVGTIDDTPYSSSAFIGDITYGNPVVRNFYFLKDCNSNGLLSNAAAQESHTDNFETTIDDNIMFTIDSNNVQKFKAASESTNNKIDLVDALNVTVDNINSITPDLLYRWKRFGIINYGKNNVFTGNILNL